MATEYIEREAAKRELLSWAVSINHPEYLIKDDALHIIDSIPAADVAEVVRCSECKHWKPTGSKAGNSFSDMEYIGGCEFTKYCRRESDFCSYGERKEGAD